MYSGTPFDIKKFIVFFFILHQHITADSSTIKFTCLIPGNVCVLAEGTVKPEKILVLIQHHVKRIINLSSY